MSEADQRHERLLLIEIRALLRVESRYGSESSRQAAQRMLDRLELNQPLLSASANGYRPSTQITHEQ